MEKQKVFKTVGFKSKRPNGKPLFFVNMNHSQYSRLIGNSKPALAKGQTIIPQDPIVVEENIDEPVKRSKSILIEHTNDMVKLKKPELKKYPLKKTTTSIKRSFIN